MDFKKIYLINEKTITKIVMVFLILKIENIETKASNGGALGGIKVTTENAWFAARPSGTEDVFKIYGESFNGSDHLDEVLEQAQSIVDAVISSK